MIKVQLLGLFGIYNINEEITLPTAKAKQLAAYLFWQQGRWVRRDFLQDIFWGDCDERRASAYLRQAIYYLKKALKTHGYNDSILEWKPGAIRVLTGPDICVDLYAFEKEAELGLGENRENVRHLANAVSIYQGDFLDGVDTDWCLVERNRILDIYLGILETLVQNLCVSGLYEKALTYAHQWLLKDPLNEAAYRALMSIYVKTGQLARAVQQYEICKQTLAAELGILPGNETMNLYRELGLSDLKITENRLPGLKNSNTTQKIRARQTKRLSKDALRNASFLVVSGEDMALQGNIEGGMKALKKALNVYEKLGDAEAKAVVYLATGTSLLYTPTTPQPDKALNYIKAALSHYRLEGKNPSLRRALLLAADASWQSGRIDEAAAFCEEGLKIVTEPNDKCSESSFLLILGIARMAGNRMKEAHAALDKAVQALAYFNDIHDVLKIVFYRSIFAQMSGDLRSAERFMREAIDLTQAVTQIPRIKLTEYLARGQLIFLLYLQDRHDEIEFFDPPDQLVGFELEKKFMYLLTRCSEGIDHRTAVKNFESWLRKNLVKSPFHYACGGVRHLTAEMCALENFAGAACWASVGVRITRARGLYEHEALFYSLRAAALAKAGKVGAAEVCCKRARRTMDEGEIWTPAHLFWADGLIARAKGKTSEATHLITKSISLFKKIGFRYILKQVQADLNLNI